MVLTEMSCRRTCGGVARGMNLISSWTDQSLALTTRQVNMSELSQLREVIRGVETVQVEVVNSPVFQQTRAKVEKINQMLPKRLPYLAEKEERVGRLVEMVEGRKQRRKETPTLQPKRS